MAHEQWNLKMVKAREAYEMLRLARPDPDGEVDWGEVEVAHIDTGYTRHSVFGPWQGDRSGVLLPEDGLNLIESGQLPLDPLDYAGQPGHGTRTCSVLCGNLAGRFSGVAPGLPTIPYRAIERVVIKKKKARKRIAKAIRHAVDDNGAEVISMSLGFPFLSLFGTRHLGEAVDHAYERGVIVVAAGGQIVDVVTYPGKFWRSIGVGGVKPNGEVWFKYQETMAREWIDIWAPSDDVIRANTVLENGQPVEAPFETGDGTSYGTVHVAAAAGMWLAFHGDELDNRYPEPWQRIEAFRTLIQKTSQKVRGSYWPDKKKGILDIEALLKAPLPAANKLKEEKRKAAKQFG